jgi:hypothetical protein
MKTDTSGNPAPNVESLQVTKYALRNKSGHFARVYWIIPKPAKLTVG